jgi:hypothetical protein
MKRVICSFANIELIEVIIILTVGEYEYVSQIRGNCYFPHNNTPIGRKEKKYERKEKISPNFLAALF